MSAGRAAKMFIYPRVQVRICLDRATRLVSVPYGIVRAREAKDVIAQIIKELDISTDKELVLRINSQKGSSLVLHDNDYPVRICKDLIVLPDDQTNITDNLMPYYLHLSARRAEEKTVLVIPLIDENHDYVYTSRVIYQRKEKSEHTKKSICKFLSKLHGTKVSSMEVVHLVPPGVKDPVTGKQKTEDDRILESAFSSRLYVRLKWDSPQRKAVIRRTECVKELVDREREYIETLRTFPEYVREVLVNLPEVKREFSSEDIDKYIKVVENILRGHEMFYSSLVKLHIGFATEVSELLRPHIEFLKLYAEYYMHYKKLKVYMEAATRNSDNVELFRRFEANPGCYVGLESIMGTVSGRIAKYLTNIKELDKLTPKNHPDHAGIRNVSKRVVEISKDIDFGMSSDERAMMLERIQSKLEDPLNLQQPGREFVACFMAQCNKTKYELILLNDKMLITVITKAWHLKKPVFYDYGEVNVMEYGEQSVILRGIINGIDTDTKFTFENGWTRQQFVAKLKGVIIQYQQKRMEDQITLKWECSDTPIALAYHKMVYCKEKLWVFGGKDDRGNVNTRLFSFDLKNNMEQIQHESSDNDPPARFRAAMCASEDALYVFGGTIDNREPLSDFWKFDIRRNVWQKIETIGDVWPVPCVGLHMEFYDDRLLLTGGTDKFNIYQYIIAENRWEYIESDNCIPPIIDHVVVRVPGANRGRCGLIIGGQSEDRLPNNHVIMFYEHGRTSRYIKTLSLNPVNRAQCSACLNGNNVYVYGGTNLDTPLPYALVLPTQCWTVPTCHFGGAMIPELRGAAMTSVNGVIYLHGGQSEIGDIYGHMYMITDATVGELTEDIAGEISTFEEDTYVRHMLSEKERKEDWDDFEDNLSSNTPNTLRHSRRPTITRMHLTGL